MDGQPTGRLDGTGPASPPILLALPMIKIRTREHGNATPCWPKSLSRNTQGPPTQGWVRCADPAWGLSSEVRTADPTRLISRPAGAFGNPDGADAPPRRAAVLVCDRVVGGVASSMTRRSATGPRWCVFEDTPPQHVPIRAGSAQRTLRSPAHPTRLTPRRPQSVARTPGHPAAWSGRDRAGRVRRGNARVPSGLPRHQRVGGSRRGADPPES